MLAPWIQLLVATLVACGVMAVLWRVAMRSGNAGIVDVAWSGLIGLHGVTFACLAPVASWLVALPAALLAIWSVRLTSYLYGRVVGHEEDGRYQQMREDWGERFPRNLFYFYQLQAVTTVFFAWPVWYAVNAAEPPAAGWQIAGFVLWLVGVSGIALADAQLAAFKRQSDTKGKTCRRGLWRYSRHPNYFFEWVHWCAYVPLAMVGPAGWATVSVPAILLYFILYKTGIPPTERQAIKSRGDDYRRYQQTTSPFVPWFPKEAAE